MTAVPDPDPRSPERGMILALVLVLALLLSVSMISFTRRAVIDTMIIRNRDAAQRASALARGGVRLGTAMLIEDRLAKNLNAFGDPNVRLTTPGNTEDDAWNQLRHFELADPDGGRLKIEIRDASALLNLNAVVPYTGEDVSPDSDAEEFLVALLEKVIEEMPLDPAEKELYDERELARNLIDWMDSDGIRAVGGGEDDYYQAQDPPYRASNGPLLSVEEIGLVEGFDVQLVEALGHYVTVYPIAGGQGINLNTAPPHVLALIYYGATDKRLADGDIVGRILKMRDQGRTICTGSAPDTDCVTLNEVYLDDGSIFPPVALPDDSNVFRIRARGIVGEIERSVVAVVDRSELTNPQLLFWRSD